MLGDYVLKANLTFCADLNPARGVPEVCVDENPW